jgi:hypothetical protein
MQQVGMFVCAIFLLLQRPSNVKEAHFGLLLCVVYIWLQ